MGLTLAAPRVCSPPAAACASAEIIPFFQKVELSPDNKDVFSCYLELAEKVRHAAAAGWGPGCRSLAAAPGFARLPPWPGGAALHPDATASPPA